MSRAPVCLLTDFGLADAYVGVMKGVLLRKVPDLQIVDITHDVPPQDVRFAAFQLLESYRFFSPGTLFICVVDPGVGSERDILYVEAGGFRFLAPDNGLLSWVLDEVAPERVFAVDVARVAEGPVSQTFHGRDVFSPAAARLVEGEKPEAIGHRSEVGVRIPFPRVKRLGALWEGQVLLVDRFGNLITNFKADEVKPLAQASKLWIEFGDKQSIRGLSSSYSEVEEGKLLAIAGSSGFVEISARNASAAKVTGLKAGDKLELRFRT